ncbi:MAG TPA: IPT/TIG domain-containing protein [Bryobacteraceae bacterium]|jgi:uncharacterized protein (TIGR03437 family)
MRLFTNSVLCSCLLALTPLASASVATYGPTNEKVTNTGLGGDLQGRGQNRVTWGNCVFSGGNTTCTVTAPFTGFGGGGTIAWVLTYPGNGPSPLGTDSQTPGSDLLGGFYLTGPSSFVTTVTESDGTILTFYGQGPYTLYSSPTCTGLPANSPCATGRVGLTPGATITGPLTGTFDCTPIIRSSQGVISAGAYGAFSSIAPGTWVEIYGTNLATNMGRLWAGGDFNGLNAPTSLMGTTVTVAGQKAFVDYVSPGQVNVQVPSNVPTGVQPVVVTTGGGVSIAYSVQVNTVQPGLLAPPQFVINGTQYVVAVFPPDGGTYVLPPGITNAVPTRRAKPGDTIVMYGVGFGPVSPNIPAGQIAQGQSALGSFKISFAGTPATVNYAGLGPNFVGLYQFNVVVPSVTASDTVPVTFSDGSVNGTQTMVIAIGN